MGRAVDPRKHEVILEAAGHLFLKQGFAAVSIETIASQAAVSKVTIYKRFETKERLFREAVRQQCAELEVELDWDAGACCLRGELISFGQSLNAFFDRPKLVQFQRRLGADLEDHPEAGTAFLEAGPRHVLGRLAELLSAAHCDGRIATSSIDQAAEQFVSLCRGLGDIERRFGQLPIEEETARRVEAAVDLFLSVYGRKSIKSHCESSSS